MAWCRLATSHYLSQCWPRSLSSYDITRPQWVNDLLLAAIAQQSSCLSLLKSLTSCTNHFWKTSQQKSWLFIFKRMFILRITVQIQFSVKFLPYLFKSKAWSDMLCVPLCTTNMTTLTPWPSWPWHNLDICLHVFCVVCSQCLVILLKVADISNEVRPLEVADPWVECLLQEFFNQVELQVTVRCHYNAVHFLENPHIDTP